MTSSTYFDKRAASSTPSAVRSATPIPSISRPADLPRPRTRPPSRTTACPSGNTEARMLSSVMTCLLQRSDEFGKVVICHTRNGGRLTDTQAAPYIDRVLAATELLQPLLKAPLFGNECFHLHRRYVREQCRRSGAKACKAVVGETICTTDQATMLATHRAPYQGPVLRIELLDTTVGFDDFRPGHTDAPLFRHSQRRTEPGDQATTAIAPGATTDQANDRNTGQARLDHGTHDLGDRQLAGIGLLQPNTTGIEQHQYRHRTEIARSAQQAGQLGAMHLTEGAAHEAPFLRGDENRLAVEATAPDDHAVVELLRQIEQRQVRARFALCGADKFIEAAGVEQSIDTLPCGCLIPTGRQQATIHLQMAVARAHACSPSSARTACASRSATISGRAPPSLIESRTPPLARRSTKSATTACHTSPKPSAAVLISTSHSLSGSKRSASTSRLPEATTPTIASLLVPAARRWTM